MWVGDVGLGVGVVGWGVLVGGWGCGVGDVGLGGWEGFCIHDNDAEGSAELSRKTPVAENLFFHLSVGVRDALQTEYDNE